MSKIELQEQPPTQAPLILLKELPWWKITYFVTAFSVIRPDFCIQFFHLALFQVHYYNLQRSPPTTPPSICLAIVEDIINIKHIQS
jgi:hypothetical protein